MSRELNLPVTFGGFNRFLLRGEVCFSGAYFFRPYNSDRDRQKPYQLVNLSAPLASGKGLTVRAYVQNLTNRNVVSHKFCNFVVDSYLGNYLRATHVRPRGRLQLLINWTLPSARLGRPDQFRPAHFHELKREDVDLFRPWPHPRADLGCRLALTLRSPFPRPRHQDRQLPSQGGLVNRGISRVCYLYTSSAPSKAAGRAISPCLVPRVIGRRSGGRNEIAQCTLRGYGKLPFPHSFRGVSVFARITHNVRDALMRPVFANLRQRLSDTDFSLQAAGIAFFAFLSIVPLIGSVALAYGLVTDPVVLEQRLEEIKRLFPRETAAILQEPIRLALESAGAKQGLALLVSLVVAIFAARGAASAIITALNNAYDREETRSFFRLQGTALLLTAAIIVTLVATFSVASLITLIGTRLLPASPITELAMTVISVGLLTAISAAVVASMFRWVPDHTEAHWKWITPGSVLTAFAWFVLSSGFSWYADNFGKFGTVYGSLGAIVALLTWLYFSAMALFVGACLNRTLEAVAKSEMLFLADREAPNIAHGLH